ncbi:TniQ family protein [Marinobacter caseinilyticus]|uniref:TniQ family protein n=1 Tax=Marinobacter caseinilyticus TaxID=2692195 RepID=UPI00140DF83A|nr:TniQ family protein [Marinobacter caseinilyticus]
MRRFAVRPEPLENESFNGFLLRIGKLNCLFKHSEIVKYLDCEPTPAPGHYGWLETPSKQIFRALERKLEKPLDKHRSRFKERAQLRWLFSKSRMIIDLRLGFPRICTTCVSEHGTLDWRWGLAVTAHCPEHECLLTSNCPKCDKELKWTSSLLIGCPYCEKSWSELDSPQPSEISKTERQLWEDMGTMSNDVDESLLQDICLAIIVAMRPFDLVCESVRNCPKMMEHSRYVARAYSLLVSPSTNAAWLKQCHGKRRELNFLGQEFVEAPYNNFSSLLVRKWRGPNEQALPTKELSFTEHAFSETTQYISQSRRDKALESDGQSNYRFQTNVVSFARILGLSKESAQDYFRWDVLESHKNVKYSTSRRFDLRELKGIIQKRPSPANSIEIFPDNPIFSRFPITFGQLANEVMLNRVAGGFSDTRGVRSVFLHPKVLKEWLIDQLNRTNAKGLSMQLATKALHCSRESIHNLVADNSLKWEGANHFEPRVDNQSFCEYVMHSERIL